MKSWRPSRILLSILGAALPGLAVFGLLASRVIILDETSASGDRLLVWAE